MIKKHFKPTKEKKGGIVSKETLLTGQTLKVLMKKKKKTAVKNDTKT